jgi:hypothetical protein
MDESAEELREAGLRDTAHDMWRLGYLRFLLDETQRELYDAFHASTSATFVAEMSRQIGKSFTACVLACEAALQYADARVNFITKTYRSAQDIVKPSMRFVLASAPPELAPAYKESESRWTFPNGAFIQLVGADDERAAERVRGSNTILSVLDEAAFLDVLKMLLDDVIGPQLIRTDGKGRVLITSTPPIDPAHHFVSVADAALAQNAYLNRDYWSPGLVSRHEKEAHVAREAASRNMSVAEFSETPYFKREYLALRVLDETRAVCPEFTVVRKDIVRDVPREPFFDLYIGGDLGLIIDQTVILFAVSAFREAKLRIEHEIVLTGASTKPMSERIAAVLEEFYPNVKPHSFVVDDPSGRVVADLWEYHKISASPALKDGREAADNQMRLLIGSKRVEISPRCKVLCHQLATGMRDPRTGDLARGNGHHLDAIAACRYLLRSWEPNRNPYPADWDFDPTRQARREPPRETTLADLLRGAL